MINKAGYLSYFQGKPLVKNAQYRTRPLHRIEGIIVKTFDYQEYDKLIQIFTKSEGMRTLIAKKANHPKSRAALPSSPFIHAEFVFDSPEKTLPVCREVTPISHYLGLRKNIDRLNSACKMVSALCDALLPGKEAPLLFDLLKCYFDKLLETEGSRPLEASFLLKLLRHEGVFALPLSCSECQQLLDDVYVGDQGFFCEAHATAQPLIFSARELAALQTLMYSRHMGAITETIVKEHFLWKIEALYKKVQSWH